MEYLEKSSKQTIPGIDFDNLPSDNRFSKTITVENSSEPCLTGLLPEYQILNAKNPNVMVHEENHL